MAKINKKASSSSSNQSLHTSDPTFLIPAKISFRVSVLVLAQHKQPQLLLLFFGFFICHMVKALLWLLLKQNAMSASEELMIRVFFYFFLYSHQSLSQAFISLFGKFGKPESSCFIVSALAA